MVRMRGARADSMVAAGAAGAQVCYLLLNMHTLPRRLTVCVRLVLPLQFG